MLHSLKKARIPGAYYFRGWYGYGLIKNRGNVELAYPKNTTRLEGLLRPNEMLEEICVITSLAIDRAT